MGMIQLLASFPTGFLADHYRRDSMLRVASLVGMVAAIITFLSLRHENEHLLRLALAAWGIFWGITNTALTALFADSVPKGSRPKYFTQRAVLLNMGNIVGPLVAIMLFSRLGNKWSLKDCAIVMAVGQVVCIASQVLLCFLNDDDANADDEESTDETAAHDESDDDSDTEGMVQTPPSSPSTSSGLRRHRQHHHHHTEVVDEDYTSSSNCSSSYKSCGLCSKHRAIPVLIAMSDVAGGLAAGMSIRYFPIFFADNLKLSPVAVQSLYILAPLCQSMLMRAAYSLSQRYGRCRVAILHKWAGILSMLLMVLAYNQGCSVSTICVIYIIRTALMNSTSALTKSVLMDSVPKSERAKWSALESVNMFSWSGSAAIGGLLVAYKGVLFNFCITAGIQFLATLPLLLLCLEEHGDEQEEEGGAVKLLMDSEDSMSLSDEDDDEDELSMVESGYASYTEPTKLIPPPTTRTTTQEGRQSRAVQKALTI
jgi:MFS family permease